MALQDANVDQKSSEVGQSGAAGGGPAGSWGGAPQPGFHGSSRHPIDAKGRLFVPKRFLTSLPFSAEGQVLVTIQPSPDGKCLWLRPGALPERTAEEFAAAGPKQKGAWRRLSALTLKTTLDASKRVLLSPELLREFGLDREVVMVGIGPAVEIWATSAWEAAQADLEAGFQSEQEALAAEERAHDQAKEYERLSKERAIREEQRLAEQQEGLRAELEVIKLRLELEQAKRALRELGVDPDEEAGA